MRDEGYVKYEGHLEDGPLPHWSSIEDLHLCRQELFAKGLIGVYPDGIGFGNVSKYSEDGRFVITGSATGGKELLENSDYVTVVSFNPEKNTLTAVGAIPASSESMTHGSIYKANDKIQSIIHIHSRVLFDFMKQGNYCSTPGTVPYGTPEMAKAVVELMDKINNASGLFYTAGHDEGVFAFGVSVDDAMQQLEKLLTQYESEK